MSRVEDILKALIYGGTYSKLPQSRVEEILLSILNSSSYSKDPASRVEDLFLAIKNSSEYDGTLGSRVEDILVKKLAGEVYDGPIGSAVEKLLADWTLYEDLAGINFDANSWLETSVKLSGTDILRFKFAYSAAGNVLGCYTGSDADDNFCIYATSSAYFRYDGGLYRPTLSANTTYEVIMGPDGYSLNGTKTTYTEKMFQSNEGMLIGNLPNSAAAKLKGYVLGNIVVDGKLNACPKKRISDNVIGYLDSVSGEFLTNKGSGTLTAHT